MLNMESGCVINVMFLQFRWHSLANWLKISLIFGVVKGIYFDHQGNVLLALFLSSMKVLSAVLKWMINWKLRSLLYQFNPHLDMIWHCDLWLSSINKREEYCVLPPQRCFPLPFTRGTSYNLIYVTHGLWFRSQYKTYLLWGIVMKLVEYYYCCQEISIDWVLPMLWFLIEKF